MPNDSDLKTSIKSDLSAGLDDEELLSDTKDFNNELISVNAIDFIPEDAQSMPQSNTDNGSRKISYIWKYFDKIDKRESIAKCKLCNKRLSYKTTTSNLSKHYKRCDPVDPLAFRSNNESQAVRILKRCRLRQPLKANTISARRISKDDNFTSDPFSSCNSVINMSGSDKAPATETELDSASINSSQANPQMSFIEMPTKIEQTPDANEYFCKFLQTQLNGMHASEQMIARGKIMEIMTSLLLNHMK